MVDNKPEFEILEILDTKIDNCHHACKLLYLICWTGYKGTDEETLWILASKLGHVSELVADFVRATPRGDSNGSLTGRGDPKMRMY